MDNLNRYLISITDLYTSEENNGASRIVVTATSEDRAFEIADVYWPRCSGHRMQIVQLATNGEVIPC